MPLPKLHKNAALCGGGDGHEESDFHLSKIQDSTGNRQDFKLFPAAVLGRAVIGLL
jgi:hypothetical protein